MFGKVLLLVGYPYRLDYYSFNCDTGEHEISDDSFYRVARNLLDVFWCNIVVNAVFLLVESCYEFHGNRWTFESHIWYIRFLCFGEAHSELHAIVLSVVGEFFLLRQDEFHKFCVWLCPLDVFVYILASCYGNIHEAQKYLSPNYTCVTVVFNRYTRILDTRVALAVSIFPAL